MDFNNILIVKLGSIGDIIHTLPSLNAIKSVFPYAKISWVVEEKSKEILLGNKNIDKLYIVDTKRWRKEIRKPASFLPLIKEVKGFFKILRNENFDLALDFQGLIKSGIITFFSNAKFSIGFDKENCREPLNAIFTKIKVAPSKGDNHMVNKNLSLLKKLGIRVNGSEFRLIYPDLEIQKLADKIFLEYNLDQRKFTVGIYPGGGWVTKRWEIDKFAMLFDLLKEKFDPQVLLISGKGEEFLVEEINRKTGNKALVICGTTLKELTALLSRIDLFIGGDTGPLHMASAMGIPTVAIFGPSDPEKNGPYGNWNRIVQKDLECKNCYKRTCDSVRCMKEVQVKEVFEAAGSLINIINSKKNRKQSLC
ncbi:MAG: hypothetical protein A3C43_11315 [Candidatus Schekmanbacteria bacterium RIFCSPHIGHO2_02_FULL_38_11]|uniref:Lipopolysaccharide heptosyltransferase I n=1 Tax=Candidatus Schekmanbacteria bacterium RIFCSPLOWO2_12_FULL_38_15 TaxID=1817883 RepID=A0A1F7SLE7_9BACT|nr:MAG: hypothetical protein A2043_04895 [Candidatus Schekmanbacteria bacterium GWA2_38_9]OGL51711.1 MAG: hypothetical protein A3H37_11735 [Candidatus Schekmanbacteria bacterium RIFCSPLOWO2_02_FULL_38_14]OGL52379.1 MAG: hypothetical protein A3C43_11315 [Candidatus Schekmanbacteria bacterium RIFCSPHIGHO2_02_FULL_38_11]OGL54034.1 MAG: hypothetical protein A3G31_04210 [Candidatus Schekmanbacteria bacterium RIFCSPLOWO2_12_FULL_38_15]